MTKGFALAVLLLIAAPASAQGTGPVAEGRAAGVVGERFDGYLGIAVEAPALLRNQVQSINIRRRALYSDLSARRGVALQEVGITAACQLLGTVGVGQRYMLSDGVWRTRKAGEGAPVPDYCR